MNPLVWVRQVYGSVGSSPFARLFVDPRATASFEIQVLMLHSPPCQKTHTMGKVCLRPGRRKGVILPLFATPPEWVQHPWIYA